MRVSYESHRLAEAWLAQRILLLAYLICKRPFGSRHNFGALQNHLGHRVGKSQRWFVSQRWFALTLFGDHSRVTGLTRTLPIREGLPTLAANLCPLSGGAEFARFADNLGEPVGQAVEASAGVAMWEHAAEHFEHMLSRQQGIDMRRNAAISLFWSGKEQLRRGPSERTGENRTWCPESRL